jgi:hypothetical protein
MPRAASTTTAGPSAIAASAPELFRMSRASSGLFACSIAARNAAGATGGAPLCNEGGNADIAAVIERLVDTVDQDQELPIGLCDREMLQRLAA